MAAGPGKISPKIQGLLAVFDVVACKYRLKFLSSLLPVSVAKAREGEL